MIAESSAARPGRAKQFHPFVFIGGTFTRFSDDELRSRYTSRRHDVERVRLAVGHLAAKGYISNQDP